jgi:hypothetical protein
MTLLLVPGMILALLLTGLPVIGSLSFVALICLQSILGQFLYLKFFGTHHTSRKLEPIGVLLGVLAFTLFSQIIRPISQSDYFIYFWWGVTGLTGAYSLFRIRPEGWKFPRWTKNLVPTIAADLQDFAFLATSGLLLLSHTWFWLRIPAVSLAAALVLQLRSEASLTRKIKMSYWFHVTAIISLIVCVKTRQDFWWLPSWGIDERKMLADGVTNFGPFSDILSAGIKFKYQWLAYGVLGDWSKYSLLSTWQVVGRVDQVVASLLIPLTVREICLELGLSKAKSRLSTLASSTLVTILSYPVGYSLMPINYMPLGIVLILCVYLQMLRWSQSPTKQNFILLTLLGLAAVAAKSVHIYPLLVGTSILTVWLFARYRQKVRLMQCLVFNTALVIYSFAYFPNVNKTGLELGRVFSFLGELGNESLSQNINLLTGSLILFVWCFPIFGVLISEGFPKRLDVASVWLGVTGLAGLVIASFATRVSGTQLHFLQVPITVALAVFPATLIKSASHETRTKKSPVVLCAVLVGYVMCGILTWIILSKSTELTTDSRILLVQLGVSLAAGFLTTGFAFKIASVGTRRAVALGIISSLIINLPITLYYNSQRLIHQPIGSYQLGSPELQEVAHFINQNTQLNEIGATDLLFSDAPNLCPSATPNSLGSIVDQARKQNFFTPAVLVERRFLVAAPAYGFIFLDEWPDERIFLSLKFGCHPDYVSLASLQNFGVSWFLTQNVNIDAMTWEKFGDVVFKNSKYLVLYLRARQ